MSSHASLGFLLGALTAAAGVGACILADPPPIAELPPATQPHILTGSVSPPLDQTLGPPPSGVQSIAFAVPVLADSDQTLQWRVFVDGDQFVESASGREDGGVMATGPGEAGPADRVIQFTLQASAGITFDTCHKFTIVVAYLFADQVQTGAPIETPLYPPGGDTATWTYEPVADCNAYDAAPPFDASSSQPDAGDAD